MPRRRRLSKGYRKFLRRQKAGLRMTDSGILTRKPKSAFQLVPQKRPGGKTPQQRYREDKSRKKAEFMARRKGAGKKTRRATKGARAKREKKEGKKKK